MSKHFIGDVPRYFVPYTSDCFQNAYGALVSYLGLNPDLILADYLSFMYEPETGYIGMNFLHKPSVSFEFNEEQMNTSLEYVYFPAVTSFSVHGGEKSRKLPPDKIKISLYIENEPGIAYSRMRELIDNDIPVVAVVDLYHMRYHRAYQRDHGAHAVIITGYDEEEGCVELFDKYSLSSSDFDGRIPTEELMQARCSENCQGSYSKPIKNMWMEVTKGDSFFYNDERWNSIIDESCRRMSGEKEVLGFKCGLGTIDAFRRDLLLRRENTPGEELFPFFRHYYNMAFKLISRSRMRFSVFLRGLAAALPDGLAEEAAGFLEESSRRWEIGSNLLLRLAITKNTGALDNLCSQLEIIKDNESRAVDKLLGYIINRRL